MTTRVSLLPAYGRDYKNKKEIIESMTKGHDFVLSDMFSPWDGKPCSPLTDFPEAREYQVRYRKLTKVTIITRKEIGG